MEIEKKVAVLGGSFDPPTIAHIQVVAEVYNECEFIDEVWIIPCGDARSDKKLKANGKDRIAMLELILEDIIDERVPIFVNDFEVSSGKYYPTYDLMKELKEKHPTYDFYFIMGSDLVDSYKNWDSGEKLSKEINFIILNRPGYKINETMLPEHCTVLQTSFEGSSTQIRSRLNEHFLHTNRINLGINGLTTTRVIRYIIEKGLYLINCIK